jgi:hypothetical protein
MTYDHESVGWLYDVLNGLDWRVSVLDVLETDRRYPGLMSDLSVEGWQRKIVKEQMTGGKKDDDIDGLGE